MMMAVLAVFNEGTPHILRDEDHNQVNKMLHTGCEYNLVNYFYLLYFQVTLKIACHNDIMSYQIK